MFSYKSMVLYAWLYPYVKAVHVSFVIFLMSGVLYLPRLFYYHQKVLHRSEAAALLRNMARRLVRFIIHPSWIAVALTGLYLLLNSVNAAIQLGTEFLWTARWLFVKLVCVVCLVVYHGLCIKWMKDIENGTCVRSSGFFRLINEVPAVLALIVVFVVIVKP